jgi:hypothetical protein
MRKIVVSSAPHLSLREALVVITEAIHEEAGCALAERVDGRIVAEVPTRLPTIIVERRLADAGIRARVEAA